MNLDQIYEKLPTQNDCTTFLEMCFWNNEPTCPYCNSRRHTSYKKQNRYHCKNCITSFSVTVGTIFHNTRVDIQKWLRLLYIIYFDEDMSSRKLSYHLKVTKDTALRMKRKVNIGSNKSQFIIESLNNKL